MVMGTLGLMLAAGQVVELSAEIGALDGMSALSRRVFDLPAHILLVCVALPAVLAMIGIWRSR